MAKTLSIKRTWARGGAGLPIPDAKNPNVRVVLESMQADINQIRTGLAITTADGSDPTTTQALANAIKVALNAVSITTAFVTFEATPVGASQ